MQKNIIMAVVGVAVVGVSFYGGTLYEKHSLTSGMVTFRGNAQFAGRIGGQGGAGARDQFGQGGFAAGEIVSHDANGITIKLMDGSSKIVILPASATISKSVNGTSADLVAGQYVTVGGTPNSDGSVTASSLQLRPAPSASPSVSPSRQQ